MKILTYIIILAWFIQACQSNQSNIVQNWELNQYKGKSQFTYLNGTLNGPYIELDSSLIPIQTGMFVNGMKNGLFRRFGNDGVLQSETEYINDTIVLKRRFNELNGNIWSEEKVIQNDSIVLKVWWPAGLMELGSKVNDKRVGIWSTWHSNNQLQSQGAYMFPPYEDTAYSEPMDTTINTSILHSSLRRNVKVGEWKYYTKNGELERVENY